MTIQRYDWSSIEPWAEFKKMPNGDYMLYNDHLAIISIYEARLAEREATIEEITQKYHAAIARELRTIGREQEVRAGLVEALEPLADLDDDDLNRHLTLEEIAVFRAALDAAKEIK